VKLLLDTHTFIWWDSDPARLSATALALCSDATNDLFLSVTSLWEMQIKRQLGKPSLAFSRYRRAPTGHERRYRLTDNISPRLCVGRITPRT
jgi:PIN domain nuclease of toxin-antitoxin system